MKFLILILLILLYSGPGQAHTPETCPTLDEYSNEALIGELGNRLNTGSYTPASVQIVATCDGLDMKLQVRSSSGEHDSTLINTSAYNNCDEQAALLNKNLHGPFRSGTIVPACDGSDLQTYSANTNGSLEYMSSSDTAGGEDCINQMKNILGVAE